MSEDPSAPEARRQVGEAGERDRERREAPQGGGARDSLPSVRALLIEPFFHRPGHFPEEVVELGRALARAGADVEVVTPRPVELAGLDARAAMVPNWLIGYAPRTSGAMAAVVDCLTIWSCVRAAVKAAGPDAVLVCVSGRFLAFFAAAAMTGGRAWAFFVRDFSRVGKRRLLDRLLHGPTHLLARLGRMRNQVALISIVDPEVAATGESFGLPVVYIPPVGVRTHAGLPPKRDARERLGLPADDPLLLVFGLAHSGKDYAVIFRALEHLRSPLKIVFAGAAPKDSPEHPRELKKRFDREDRVLVRDEWIPREEVPYYFAAADGLLLSYRPGYVVDSGVLCEGVAMDRPMVGTQEGSIGQALTHWPLGLTFPAGDAAALARQMEALTALPPATATAFAEGRRRFRERYSWERIADQHLALYRNLLA
jgi:glycosyltransferase involved in cell wall biosynthesis